VTAGYSIDSHLAIIAIIGHPDTVEVRTEDLVIERDAVPRPASFTLHHMQIGQSKQAETLNDMVEQRLRIAVM
jgi:hypothetical protein